MIMTVILAVTAEAREPGSMVGGHALSPWAAANSSGAEVRMWPGLVGVGAGIIASQPSQTNPNSPYSIDIYVCICHNIYIYRLTIIYSVYYTIYSI